MGPATDDNDFHLAVTHGYYQLGKMEDLGSCVGEDQCRLMLQYLGWKMGTNVRFGFTIRL